MLKTQAVQQLDNSAAAAVARVLDADPVASCMVAARVQEFGLQSRLLPGQMWTSGSPRDSLCYSGTNLVPLRGQRDALRAFAEYAAARPRMCSTVVGRRELALPMWELLAPSWGPARELRADQPLLALTGKAQAVADPLVRQAQPHELNRYLAAAIAMFTEEMGTDPRASDGGRGYRRRVANLIAAGRAWVRFEDGEVVFKAEVGSMSRATGQIQGVWVHPDRRGAGLGTAGVAAVANMVTSSGRTASLYVNSYNVAARRAYERAGFRQAATFATILLD